MKKVLVFGTFDGIHKGHLNLFKQARKYGDYLVVVVARDRIVLRVKGHLPEKNEKIRLKEVRKIADEARLGYLKNPFKIINEIKPNIICLGYDQKFFVDELYKLGIKIIRLKPYKKTKYHSSILKHARYKQN